MRTYNRPLFIADASMKRLHADIPAEVFEDVEDLRKKCEIGDAVHVLVDFEEALRLYNEEAFRTCGVCLQEGGEVSNWKERAERAEADVRGLNSRLEQSDELATNWKERAEAVEAKLRGEG